MPCANFFTVSFWSHCGSKWVNPMISNDTEDHFCFLGCIKRSMASRVREVILPLRSGETPSAVLRPALEPSAQEGHGPVGAGPEEGHKNDQIEGTPLL